MGGALRSKRLADHAQRLHVGAGLVDQEAERERQREHRVVVTQHPADQALRAVRAAVAQELFQQQAPEAQTDSARPLSGNTGSGLCLL